MQGQAVVEVRRGGRLESEHRVVAAVADASGGSVAELGDAGLVTYPRSSLKPIQALALLETGAADSFGLDSRHIALACASHHGEAAHVDLVMGWLARIGAAPADLACGAEPPTSSAAWEAIVRSATAPSRVHHNCSGKHTGFLTVCRHCGWSLAGYDRPDHPAQRRFAATLAELSGEPETGISWGVDGCTLPAAALPVRAAARALARLAAAADPSPVRRAAMAKITAAMAAHPELVSGTRHATVTLVRATAGRVVVKGGAEGFLAAMLPAAGLGIAIKITDGNGRGTFPVLVELLDRLGRLEPATSGTLAALRRPAVTDSRGREVGALVPRLDL